MANTFSETSNRSIFSNIVGAIVGVFVGLLLILVAFGLLWWNEGRTVKTARGLKEGASAVVSVNADPIDPANEGKLVHLAGEATTSETLTDPEFGISSPAVALVRTVQMYQWREDKKEGTKRKLGGGTETTTTYTYSTAWSDDKIDSSSFKHPEGHENPGELPWPSRTFTAAHVALGAFTLSPDLVALMKNREPRPVSSSDREPPVGGVKVAGGLYYRGDDPGTPKVGDVRVKFEIVRPQPVSVIATQRGTSFEPYQAQSGLTVLMLEPGTVTADAMFKAAVEHNRMLAWILRGVGLLLMFIGFVLLFRPIAVIGSVVPIFGSLLSAGLGGVSFFIALALSLLTIAVAWIAVRPVLALGLLALAVAAIVLLARMHKRRKARVTTAAPPPVPPPLPPEATGART